MDAKIHYWIFCCGMYSVILSCFCDNTFTHSTGDNPDLAPNHDAVFSCNNTVVQRASNGSCHCTSMFGIECKTVFLENVGHILVSLTHFQYNERLKKLRFKGLFAYTTPELDLQYLEYFSKLKQFELFVSKLAVYTKVLFTTYTFQRCKKLTVLRLNVPMEQDIITMIQPLDGLQVLDLSDTRQLGQYLIHALSHGLSSQIAELNLRHYQTPVFSTYRPKLNFTNLTPGASMHLRKLDLSQNSLQAISTGLFSAAPNLVYLDISDNMLVKSENTAFIIEAFMHHKIRSFNLSDQNIPKMDFQNKYRSQDEIERQQFPANVASVKSLSYWQCIDNVTSGNISVVFGKKGSSHLCSILRHCYFESWKVLSCDHLPVLDDIIDLNCAFNIRLPIGQSYEEVFYGNVNLDPTVYYSTGSIANVCFNTNNITRLYLNENANWFRIQPIINDLSSGALHVTGLDKLQELSLVQNKMFLESLNFCKGQFSELKVINVSGNEAMTDMQVCNDDLLRDLEVLDLSHSNDIGLNNVLDISQCRRLKTLILISNNYDGTFWIRFGDNPNLIHIDLLSNKIPFLGKMFRDQFDNIKNLNNNLIIKFNGKPPYL